MWKEFLLYVNIVSKCLSINIESQHVLLKKFPIFLKYKFLKKLRYGVTLITAWAKMLSMHVWHYDVEHTARASEKKKKQSIDRKMERSVDS